MSYAFANPLLTHAGISPPFQIQSAGWHDATTIHSLAGLGGTFYWPEGGGGFITFNVPAAAPPFGYTGTYSLFRWFGPSETGTFTAVGSPMNAGIILQPTGGAARAYQVQGMFTDANHKIFYMLLRSVATGEFFIPFRLGA